MNTVSPSPQNATLIMGATLQDIEHMINKAVGERMNAFYERIRDKPPVLIKRKEAAQMIGVSLPTLDQYIKFGFIKAQHLGGRVYVEENSIIAYKEKNK